MEVEIVSVLSVEVGPVVVDVVEAELEFEVDLVVDVAVARW